MKRKSSRSLVIFAFLAAVFLLSVLSLTAFASPETAEAASQTASEAASEGDGLSGSVISWFSERISDKRVLAFIISMIPIVELRLALPVCLDPVFSFQNWITIFGISVIGNLVPVPFILLLIRKIFAWMKTWGGFFEKLIAKLEKRAMSRSGDVKKYEMLGLIAFVGIPLPGTGAWTGSLIAALLDVDFKRAMLAATCGVVAAGLLVSGIFYFAAYLSGFLSVPVVVGAIIAALVAYVVISALLKKKKQNKGQE